MSEQETDSPSAGARKPREEVEGFKTTLEVASYPCPHCGKQLPPFQMVQTIERTYQEAL